MQNLNTASMSVCLQAAQNVLEEKKYRLREKPIFHLRLSSLRAGSSDRRKGIQLGFL